MFENFKGKMQFKATSDQRVLKISKILAFCLKTIRYVDRGDTFISARFVRIKSIGNATVVQPSAPQTHTKASDMLTRTLWEHLFVVAYCLRPLFVEKYSIELFLFFLFFFFLLSMSIPILEEKVVNFSRKNHHRRASYTGMLL